MLKRLLLSLVIIAGLSAPALAQNCTAPTPPPGDSSNRCATTAFVTGAISTPALPLNQIFVGNAGGLATAALMNGDCSIISGGTITCTKTNGVSFAPSATTDATNATNIITGSLPAGRLGGAYTGVSGVGNLTVGTWNATTISVGSGGTGITSGTSGGVLYFSGTGTAASSSALTANLPVIGGGAGSAPSVGTRSGNTTAFVTTTGAQTAGRCVEIDASGNHVQSASGCAGGGITIGSTTIISGTTTRILYDNAGLLGEYTITGGGTVVAMQTSPTLITPNIGTATANTINGLTITASTGTLTLSNGKTLTATTSGTLAGSDTWTLSIAALKTLTASNTITLAGTDGTTWTGPSTNATLAALNIASQTLTGGAIVTAANLGTVSSGTTTINCGTSPLQFLTNNGAFTLAAPTNDSSCIVLTTNGASAGAITFSGFSVGGATGDALTTTNTQKFSIHIWRVNGTSGYRVAAHQ